MSEFGNISNITCAGFSREKTEKFDVSKIQCINVHSTGAPEVSSICQFQELQGISSGRIEVIVPELFKVIDDEEIFENEDFNAGEENTTNDDSEPIFEIETIDITKILQSSFEGREILYWFEDKKCLNPYRRKKLVYFVIAGVLSICNRNLKSNDFKILSEKIVEIFPSECKSVYYEARVPKNKSNTGKCKKSTGKLCWKYHNLKKIAKELNKSIEIKDKAIEVNNTEASEDEQNSINWLKNREEPWDEAMQHWQITFTYRRSQIRKLAEKKISSIYEEWPILKCPKAYHLIIQDFSFCKFTNTDNAIDYFKDFCDKAFQVRNVKKNEICILLTTLLEKKDLKEDDRNLIRLALLCFVLPSVARIPQGKKRNWKPSAVETLDGIVTRIKIAGDIEKVKAERHNNAKIQNITVQPYLVVVEEDDYSVQSVYLCIDNILYEMCTFLEGLDVCFKAFHVFHACYTLPSEHICLLLQIGLYKFRTVWDTKIIGVNELLNDMDCSINFE